MSSNGNALESVLLTDIKIGRRVRRDMGNIESLCKSIENLGLLQPIAIDTEGRLIAGRRRIEAFTKLERESIPCFRVSAFTEILDRLKAELDENTCREDFDLDELHAMGKRLEPYLKKEAKKRQGMRTDKHSGKFPESSKSDSRDQIGSAIGIFGKQWEKLDDIMESGDEKLIEDAVRTRKVDGVHRRLKIKEAAEQIASEPPPLPEGPFRVIVIDPPWEYYKRSNDPSHRGSNPYPSMSLEEIKSIDVNSIAHDDCVLWLWTTSSHLPHSFEIIESWGFTYKTTLTWAKQKMGTGDWLRGKTEHCLMCVRGKPTITLSNQTTLLPANVGKHSEKPEEFYQFVESLCPGSKAELFSRKKRKGWIQHGNEVHENKQALAAGEVVAA
jgi:N6-adenosine-specific RNA methylase IME4